LERIPEEDGEDKSNYESFREGGVRSGPSLNQSNINQISESIKQGSEDEADETKRENIE
jgi:hypothetical protein